MTDAAAREQDNTETDAAGLGLRVPFSEDETRRAPAGGTPTPPKPARRRLARLVAATLALDLVFVGAFALYTYSANYPRGFEGALEHADGRGARGWVVDLERPGEAVEVQLFENGRFVASAVADGPPPGESGGAGRRGFAFNFERELYGEREVCVYAVRAARGGTRRTLQQVGAPRGFNWK